MRIALCDDNPTLTRTFTELIMSWSAGSGCKCQVVCFHSPKELLFETQGTYPFELMLLDIEMPDMSGMELARIIRRTDQKVLIAFLTNYADFVFDGYEVGAFRYLLKAQANEKLFPLLDEAGTKLEREKHYLLVKAQGEDIRLELTEILYLEADRHDTIIHMEKESRLLKLPISKLSPLLGEAYAMAHRSYIVNLEYVERLSRKECLMSNGERVPVSRGAFGSLNCAFISYYKGDRDTV